VDHANNSSRLHLLPRWTGCVGVLLLDLALWALIALIFAGAYVLLRMFWIR
jgi:hypothetical protein